MPIDKALSRKGAPVFGIDPKKVPGYAGTKSTPWIVRGALPPAPRNPNLALVRNTQQDQIYDAKGRPKYGLTGLIPMLYRPGGLLYKP
jgi:hypothetical protein